MPFVKLPKLLAFIGFQSLYSTSPVASHAFIPFQHLSFLPGAPQQLPAFILLQYPGAPKQLPVFIWFYIWFPLGLLKSPRTCASQQLPAFMRFQDLREPLVSPQLLAYTVMWVQYLDFRFSSQQLPPLPPASLSPIFCGHLASISTCSSNPSTPSCMLLVSISKFPPPRASQQLPAFIFGPKLPPASLSIFLHVSSCIFMYLQLVSMSKLHPSSLNNFLRSSGFNIELALPRLCLSISYIHFASYVDFPPVFSPPLLTFLLFQYPNFPCISNFLHASCLNI